MPIDPRLLLARQAASQPSAARGVAMSPAARQLVAASAQRGAAGPSRQRDPRLGVAPWERQGAAVGQRAEPDEGGIKGLLGDVLGNSVVRNALKPLELLDVPRRIAISGIEELAEALPEPLEWLTPVTKLIDEDRTRADERGFLERIKDPNYGYGQVGHQFDNKWLDRIAGFAGDVALDPLSYVTFGANKFVGSGGRAALASLATKKGLGEEVVQRIGRLGEHGLTKAEREALELGQAGMRFGIGSSNIRIPGTERFATAGGKAMAGARGALTDTAVGRAARRFGGARDPALREAVERLATGKGDLSAVGAANTYGYVTQRAAKQNEFINTFAREVREVGGKNRTKGSVVRGLEKGDTGPVRDLLDRMYKRTQEEGVDALRYRENYAPHYHTEVLSDFLGREMDDVLVDAPGMGSGRLNPRVFGPQQKVTLKGKEITFDAGDIDDIEKKLWDAFPELNGKKLIEDDPEVVLARALEDYGRDVGRAAGEQRLGQGTPSLLATDDPRVLEQTLDKAATKEARKAIRGGITGRRKGLVTQAKLVQEATRDRTQQAANVGTAAAEGRHVTGQLKHRLAMMTVGAVDENLAANMARRAEVNADQLRRLAQGEEHLTRLADEVERADANLQQLLEEAERIGPGADLMAAATVAKQRDELIEQFQAGKLATRDVNRVRGRRSRVQAKIEPERTFVGGPGGEITEAPASAVTGQVEQRNQQYLQALRAISEAEGRKMGFEEIAENPELLRQFAELADETGYRSVEDISADIKMIGRDKTRKQSIISAIDTAGKKQRRYAGGPGRYGDVERRAARGALTKEELADPELLSPQVLMSLPEDVRNKLLDAQGQLADFRRTDPAGQANVTAATQEATARTDASPQARANALEREALSDELYRLRAADEVGEEAFVGEQRTLKPYEQIEEAVPDPNAQQRTILQRRIEEGGEPLTPARRRNLAKHIDEAEAQLAKVTGPQPAGGRYGGTGRAQRAQELRDRLAEMTERLKRNDRVVDAKKQLAALPEAAQETRTRIRQVTEKVRDPQAAKRQRLTEAAKALERSAETTQRQFMQANEEVNQLARQLEGPQGLDVPVERSFPPGVLEDIHRKMDLAVARRKEAGFEMMRVRQQLQRAQGDLADLAPAPAATRDVQLGEVRRGTRTARRTAPDFTGMTPEQRAGRITEITDRLQTLRQEAPGLRSKEAAAPQRPRVAEGQARDLQEFVGRTAKVAVKYSQAIEAGATPGVETLREVGARVLRGERDTLSAEVGRSRTALGRHIPSGAGSGKRLDEDKIAKKVEGWWKKETARREGHEQTWRNAEKRATGAAKVTGSSNYVPKIIDGETEQAFRQRVTEEVRRLEEQPRVTRVQPKYTPEEVEVLVNKRWDAYKSSQVTGMKEYIKSERRLRKGTAIGVTGPEAAREQRAALRAPGKPLSEIEYKAQQRAALAAEKQRVPTKVSVEAQAQADTAMTQEFSRVVVPLAQDVQKVRQNHNKLRGLQRRFLRQPVDLLPEGTKDALQAELRKRITPDMTQEQVQELQQRLINQAIRTKVKPGELDELASARAAAERGIRETLDIGDDTPVTADLIDALVGESRRNLRQTEWDFIEPMQRFTGVKWDQPEAAITTIKGRRSQLMQGDKPLYKEELRQMMIADGVPREDLYLLGPNGEARSSINGTERLMQIWATHRTGDEKWMDIRNANQLNEALGFGNRKTGIWNKALKGKLTPEQEIALYNESLSKGMMAYMDTRRAEFLTGMYKKMSPEAKDGLFSHIEGQVRQKSRGILDLDDRLTRLDEIGGGAAAQDPMELLFGGRRIPDDLPTEDLSNFFQRGAYEELAGERRETKLGLTSARSDVRQLAKEAGAEAEAARPAVPPITAQGNLLEEIAEPIAQRGALQQELGQLTDELVPLQETAAVGREAGRKLAQQTPGSQALQEKLEAALLMKPQTKRVREGQQAAGETRRAATLARERLSQMPAEMRKELSALDDTDRILTAKGEAALADAYDAEEIIRQAEEGVKNMETAAANSKLYPKLTKQQKVNTGADHRKKINELRQAMGADVPDEAKQLLAAADQGTFELDRLEGKIANTDKYLAKWDRDVKSGKAIEIMKENFRAGTEAYQSKVTGRAGRIDPAVSKAITNVEETLFRQPGPFGKLLDEYTKFFRSYATATPGFHVRNAMSASFMNASDGVSIRNQLAGIRIWKAYRNNPSGDWWTELPARYQSVAKDVVTAVHGSGAGGAFSASEIGARAAGKRGSKLRRVVTENVYVRGSKRAGEAVEGGVRAGMALDTLLGGGAVEKARGSIDEAITRMNRIHFNYSQASEWDAQMRRIIPFWTFMSRNLPLQVQQMWTNPRTYLHYQSFKRNFDTDPEGTQPDMPLAWREQGAFRVADNLALMPDIGSNQLEETIKGIGSGRILSQLTPAAAIPLSLKTNQNLYYGTQYKENDFQAMPAELAPLTPLLEMIGWAQKAPDGTSVIERKFADAARTAIPTLAQINRLGGTTPDRKGRTDTAWMNLLGIPGKQLTPEVLAGEQRRQTGNRFYTQQSQDARRRALWEAAGLSA